MVPWFEEIPLGKPWEMVGKRWDNHGKIMIYIEHGPFSSLIYPLKMVIFHSFLYAYQRVDSNGNFNGFWELEGLDGDCLGIAWVLLGE